MKESLLNSKRILAVDDEPDVLELIKEEILGAAPNCVLDTATTYEGALELMASWTYDLVILDIMGVRGFDLLGLAVKREYPFPTVILTAHALSPECMPASSMCSIMPATMHCSPSDTASTSISMASSRNLSISMGRSGEASAALSIKDLRSSSP